MVNRGPSTGCQKCRERHTKCDKTKPACRRCIVRGYVCPGYRDVCGIVFKDQSHSVIERQRRSAHTTPTHTGFAHLRELKLDPRTFVIPFFFEKHVFPAKLTKLSSRGHFDHLVRMYSNAAPSSPLALATFATAARAIASHLHVDQKDSWLLQNDIAAAQALRTAVADQKESLRDETLLAVLCLDFGTNYVKTEAFGAPSRPHLDGALALIHHRGLGNFRSSVSRALFTATRSNVLFHALWYGDQRSRNAITSFPDIDTGIANPVTKLQCILLSIIKMDALSLIDAHSENQESYNSYYTSRLRLYQDLQTRLVTWLDTIPADWKCVFENEQVTGSWPPPGTIDRIPCLHVASLLAQWLCAKFIILKCTFTATPWEQVSDIEVKLAACTNFKVEAQAIASRVCQLLAYLGERITSAGIEEKSTSFDIRGVDSGPSLAGTARVISFNLSRWALAEFSERMLDCGGFGIAPEVLEYLHNEHEKGLALLNNYDNENR